MTCNHACYWTEARLSTYAPGLPRVIRLPVTLARDRQIH
jgi:hypothetical protein